MKEKDLEFFKLEQIDRLVLIWLIENVEPQAIKSWISFIVDDYKRRKSIEIDPDKLFYETQM